LNWAEPETYTNKVICGDSLKVLKRMPENCVDSCVSDPPYGINFMGKKWDYDVPAVEVWEELLRVLKPGAHILIACGTRTQHRMAVNIEDAGFEIRDLVSDLYSRSEALRKLTQTLTREQLKLLQLALGNDNICCWAYGSGFPKSLDIGKAIDKQAGAEREVVSKRTDGVSSPGISTKRPTKNEGIWVKGFDITSPATPEACQWDGWGTNLKPAVELWTLARKPLSEKTIAENVLKWGTGGLNIDECRVEHNEPEKITNRTAPKSNGEKMGMFKSNGLLASPNDRGRFPANLIHDGSDEVVSLFPNTTSGSHNPHIQGSRAGFNTCEYNTFGNNGDSGSAARFFYVAKASRAERGDGNIHPTCKPVALMRYLIELITPPDGLTIDSFLGSGTSAVAAYELGRKFIGIERELKYVGISRRRLDAVMSQGNLFRQIEGK